MIRQIRPITRQDWFRLLLLLLLQRINNHCTIRQKPIEIRIVSRHLLCVPGTGCCSAVFDVDDVEAFEEGVYESGPDALVAVDAADEEGCNACFLEVETEGGLGAPEAGEAVFFWGKEGLVLHEQSFCVI